jgi:hypothetical protein
MSQLVKYIGRADRRVLTQNDIDRFGAEMDGPIVWSASNAFIVEIADEHEALLEFLWSQPDFEEV